MKMKGMRWKNLKQENGAALITAMVILVAMTLLGFSLLTLSEIEFDIARNQRLAEQAVFAGERGALAGVRLAEALRLELAPGDTVRAHSGLFNQRDTYPKWMMEITKEGLAPQDKGWSIEEGAEKMTFFLYRIQSVGNSRDRSYRTIEMMIRLAEKTGSYGKHHKSY